MEVAAALRRSRVGSSSLTQGWSLPSFYPHGCHYCVASAGGKISFASREVQPGATLFIHEIFDADREKLSPQPNRLRTGAFASDLGCACSEKEQKRSVLPKTHQGATYSQE